jgi:hypothetical protein
MTPAVLAGRVTVEPPSWFADQAALLHAFDVVAVALASGWMVKNRWVGSGSPLAPFGTDGGR